MDRDSAGWWERIARQEFAVQRCETCGTRRFPARAFCAACRTESWRWEAIEPRGAVESWIVNHQAFTPDAALPYTVVMVRLDAVPGGVAFGNWHEEREPAAGEPVEAVFAGDLVNWRPSTRPEPPHDPR